MKDRILIISLVIFIVVLNITQRCDNNKDTKINNKKYEVVKTVYDTIYKVETKIVYKNGKNIFNTDVTPNKKDTTKLTSKDTNNIINRYKVYVDTISLSQGKLILTDTLYRNSILNRKFDFSFNQMIIEKNNYLKYKNNKFSYGVITTFNKNYLNVSPTLIYTTKNSNSLLLSVGVNNNFNPTLSIGYFKTFK